MQSQPAAREEEKESSKDIRSNLSNISSEKDASGGHTEAANKAASDANGAQRAVQVLLEDLCHRCASVDDSVSALGDKALDLLHNHVVLLRAQERLQSKEKLLDVIFQARVTVMIEILNLFLNPGLSYTWRKALMIIAKVQGHELHHMHSICMWVLDFVREGRLPLHSYGYIRETVLKEEDVLQEIQGALSKKAKGASSKPRMSATLWQARGFRMSLFG